MTITATSRFVPGPALTGALEAKLREAAARAVNTTAAGVFQQSQVLVPIDTGRLYESAAVTTAQGADPVPTAEVSYNTDYAFFVEYGTHKMAAEPYLRPALASHQGVLQDQMNAEAKGVMGAFA